jgi:hypothetical protein
VRVGIRALEIAERTFLTEQLLRDFQLAVEEYGQPQTQVGDERACSRDSAMPASEKLRPLSIFLSSTSVRISS